MPITAPKERTAAKTRPTRRWNLVLLDDDEHTYEYVIEMLRELFAHSRETAYAMAVEVDSTGRVIVWTGPRETAEHHQERVHAHGADPLVPRCAGSMSAIVECLD